MNRDLQILALEELRRTFDQYAAAADALDAKAMGLLSSSSLIIGLFSLLQLSFIKSGQSEQSCVYQIGVILIIIGYVGLVTLCIKTLRPREYKNTIPADWDDLVNHFLAKENSQAVDTLLSTYLSSIEENRRTNREKAKHLNRAAQIFSVLVVGLFLLSSLPH